MTLQMAVCHVANALIGSSGYFGFAEVHLWVLVHEPKWMPRHEKHVSRISKGWCMGWESAGVGWVKQEKQGGVRL